MSIRLPFHSPQGGCSTAFRYLLATAISVVWTVGYILSWVDGAQHPAPSTPVTAVMGAVVAWAFSGEVKKSLNRRDDQDDDDPEA